MWLAMSFDLREREIQYIELPRICNDTVGKSFISVLESRLRLLIQNYCKLTADVVLYFLTFIF